VTNGLLKAPGIAELSVQLHRMKLGHRPPGQIDLQRLWLFFKFQTYEQVRIPALHQIFGNIDIVRQVGALKA